MSSALTQLSSLLSNAATDLEKIYKARNITVPSINAISRTENDALSDKMLIDDPHALKAVATILGVCDMLTNMVQAPVDNVRWATIGFMHSTCVRLVIEGNIPEILREKGGNDGVHIKDIAGTIGADEIKLGRILRFLATNLIFQEVKPDVFANNRNSLALDTGLSLKDIQKPEDKISGTGQAAAWCLQYGDMVMEISLHLPDIVLQPNQKHSDSAFNHWAKTDALFFDWLNFPENRERLLQFNFGMGSQNRGCEGTDGFDWDSLPANSTVVDVGGGQGFAIQPLIKRYPGFKFIVQDQEIVLTEGRKYWATTDPEAIKSGNLTLEAHDFFGPQPVKGADLYFIRTVLHDWAEEPCVKILSKLREAATEKSKLLVLDAVLEYACPAAALITLDIPGATPAIAPEPLLSNWGAGDMYPYRLDMLMMLHFTSQERSVAQLERIFRAAGWKIIRVYRGQLAQFLAVPN